MVSVLAGVDGCPGGWFGVIKRGARVDCVREQRLTDLCHAFTDADAVFIDIPLGLPNAKPRAADRLARQLLPGRTSSVFPVPCREAVYASTWETACAANEARLGRRLSKQSWNICNKIREADELREARLFEAHPELCFQALAGKPLMHSKKRAEGHAERLALLPADFRVAYEYALRSWPRKEVARDDILDACALASTAPLLTATVPDPVEFDARGGQMAIRVTRYQLGLLSGS